MKLAQSGACLFIFRIQAIEMSALEKMQEKQKKIEEENKRKKAALQETIKKT